MNSRSRIHIMGSLLAVLAMVTFAVNASAKKKQAKFIAKATPAPMQRKSLVCTQGRGPAAGGCPNLEAAIKKSIGADVSCWSKLFKVEANCNVNEVNDPTSAHRPHMGFGMCGMEMSPAIRNRNRRGIACAKLKDIGSQMRCCASLMLYNNGKYFNSVGCGDVPRCKLK